MALNRNQLVKLRDELRADPAACGYAAALRSGNDPQVAAAVNLKRATVNLTEPVTQRAALKRLMVLGKLRALKDAADGANAAAWNTWLVLQHPAFKETGIDLFDPASQAQLTALVASGVLTSEDRASVEGLAKRNGSRAELLFGTGVEVTADEVGQALAADRLAAYQAAQSGAVNG